MWNLKGFGNFTVSFIFVFLLLLPPLLLRPLVARDPQNRQRGGLVRVLSLLNAEWSQATFVRFCTFGQSNQKPYLIANQIISYFTVFGSLIPRTRPYRKQMYPGQEYIVWQKYNVYIYYYGSYSKCIHYIFPRLFIKDRVTD